MEAFIGMSCTVLGLIIGFLTFGRSRDKELREEAERKAVMETKLDAISKGIEQLQETIKELEKEIDVLTEQVIRMEEAIKQSQQKKADVILQEVSPV